MKNKKWSALILIILTILVISYLIRGNFYDVFNVIIHAKFIYILLAILLYILYLVFQTIPFYNFTKKYNDKIKFGFMFYVGVVTNFFNGITPLATGGQPMQVYELHKGGLETVDATNAVVQNFIIFQTSTVLLGIFSYIANKIFNLVEVSLALKNITIAGLLINIAVLGIAILASFSKTLNQKVIEIIIKIFDKMHLIKDKKKTEEKWNKTCLEFYENSQILVKNKGTFFVSILSELLSLIFYYSLTFVLAYAIGCENNLTFITSIVLSSYIFIASSFLPIPGATGGMEYAFLNYFGKFIIGFKLNALLLIWRAITYYFPTIIGGIVFGIFHSKRQKKEK